MYTHICTSGLISESWWSFCASKLLIKFVLIFTCISCSSLTYTAQSTQHVNWKADVLCTLMCFTFQMGIIFLQNPLQLKRICETLQFWVYNKCCSFFQMDRYNGKYALLMDGPTAEYLANKEPCDKMVIGEPIGDHSYGFACRNDTDICDRLSTQILAMREDGRLFGSVHYFIFLTCNCN